MSENKTPYDFEAIKPNYENLGEWDFYANDLGIEYQQCIDEGLDVLKYKEVFESACAIPNSAAKKALGDELFKKVMNESIVSGYKYNEPSELSEIKKLRKAHVIPEKELTESELKSKISGAWMGRICGCLLGKPVEGIRSDEFIPLLKQSGNYPMKRYILSTDITAEMKETYNFGLENKCYADTVHGMPVDDDTNYVVLAQKIVEDNGRAFTPQDVANAWVKYQGKEAYFTAERVAYYNILNGYEPPVSAIYKNPYREWIGAQIRGDYFGYINPGNPELAAEMAFRDASVSHIKNGIYGEMFASAMIACAAVTDDIEDIILGGLGEIPETSRLYEEVTGILADYKNGVSYDDTFKKIHSRYDEYSGHGWCHTLSNAMIVTAALLYGEGDFGKSICAAVQMAFDTDCNGATVGSVIGMRNGIEGIDEYWQKPVDDLLHTSIFGVGSTLASSLIDKTFEHLIK